MLSIYPAPSANRTIAVSALRRPPGTMKSNTSSATTAAVVLIAAFNAGEVVRMSSPKAKTTRTLLLWN